MMRAAIVVIGALALVIWRLLRAPDPGMDAAVERARYAAPKPWEEYARNRMWPE